MAAEAFGALARVMLFDTDVLVDVTRDGAPAYVFPKGLGPTRLEVPGAVAMEFLIGSRDKSQLRRAQKALLAFDFVFADAKDNRLALEFWSNVTVYRLARASPTSSAPPSRSTGTRPSTFNLKHFGAIPGLDARAPYLR